MMQDKLETLFHIPGKRSGKVVCALNLALFVFLRQARSMQMVTRHLVPTPTLSPNSVGGEGELSAVSLKTSDWICRTVICKTKTVGRAAVPRSPNIRAAQ